MKIVELKPCPFCGGKALTKRSCVGVHVICSKCLLTEVYETYEEASEKWNERHSAWIPCSERLPEDGQRVLICTSMQKIFVAAYDCSAAMFRQRVRQVMHAWYDDEVTHWMPLPEPPEMEEHHES